MKPVSSQCVAFVMSLPAGLLPLGAMAQLSSPVAAAMPLAPARVFAAPTARLRLCRSVPMCCHGRCCRMSKPKRSKNRLLPVFPAPVQALNDKPQRVQGFMMPLDPGERQKHFLLSSVPMTCSFCTPGGPESMVEVQSKTPVKYSMEPVTVEGKFAVLSDDSYGLYYRMTDTVSVK